MKINDSNTSLLLPAAMAKVAEESAVYKTQKQRLSTFCLAVLAGVFISIAFVFYITVMVGSAAMPWGVAKLIGGICFSLGLMLVVACGADLFTSTVLTIIAKASRRITWCQLALNWTMVYVGNLIGALFFVALIWFSGQPFAAEGQWGLTVLNTASYKLHHSFLQALCLGILANLLVCLAIWMSYAGRSLTDKMFVMILPVAMFVACGFEHSIANMFMIPMGIVIENFAPAEFWHAIGATPEQFSHLNISQFIVGNLIPVTLGNIIGGAMLVGMTNWIIYLRGEKVHGESGQDHGESGQDHSESGQEHGEKDVVNETRA